MIDQKLSVLIIEDNASLAANIYEYLEACGHTADAAPDGESGLGLLALHRYDAVVLDWMMPRLDGMAMLERLRNGLKSRVPVIVITAKDQLENKLQGFMTGADDYVVKPVALAELEIRLRVLVQRTRLARQASQVLEVGDLRFDLGALEVTRAGKPVAMTPVRRQLLEYLMRKSPNLVRRGELESLIWNDRVPDNDALRSHMHMLRKAVDGDAAQKLVKTVAGTGYRLCVSDD
ncbi:DNA-binding response regulator, OmpR family, contains REC and winged-helix (wHTH) domain [Duganella sp. CF517]|uniref:response regulator transcription factor n=1 Tax=Duganella sp. CF517 TaxID=1881038 RepID=UPI0008B176EF|nr:response regulator transcription factor [Duganella sp. CF517]SEN06904.1 DNA-binding response regulator, OmpR family, contains REC and winged-helix (wHTH) domain [Duganella sp. CF517]